MTGIADWDVQFVGCDDAKLWIAKLPPVLMSNHGDFNGTRRLWSILNRVDHSRRGQEQNNDDQNRNNCPGQLNLSASVHLSRLAAAIHRSCTELDDRVEN